MKYVLSGYQEIILSIQNELPQEVTVQHIKKLKASNKQNNVQTIRKCISDNRLCSQQFELFHKLKNKVSNLTADADDFAKICSQNLLSSLKPVYSVGSQLQKVTDLEEINVLSLTKQISEFKPQNGMMYLIIFWASWVDFSSLVIDEIECMFKNNPNWLGNVKFVGLSCDHKTEDIIMQQEKKRWNQIEHYRFLKGVQVQDELISSFKVLPSIMLVNKWGKIVSLGHHSQINIQKTINHEIQVIQDDTQENLQNKSYIYETISKEQYRKLKEILFNVQNILNSFTLEGQVVVSLKKICVWNQNKTKEVLSRSRLRLSYDINFLEQKQLNSFLENHWQRIPENLRHVKKTKIRNPKELEKKIRGQIQQEFAALGVIIQYIDYEIHKYKFDNEMQAIILQVQNELQVEAQNLTTMLYFKGIEKLKTYQSQFELEDQKETMEKIIEQIMSGLSKYTSLVEGSQFEALQTYKKWGEDNYSEIQHKQGQVLIIDYWDQWCYQSLVELQNRTTIMKLNAQKWGKNVRAVFLNDEPDAVKDFMDSHQENLKYIDFYFTQEFPYPTLIPQTFIVDKAGTIRKVGDILNVEEVVNQLLNENQEIKKNKVCFQIDQKQMHYFFIYANIQFRQLANSNIIEFQFNFNLQKIGEILYAEDPSLTYYARDTQALQLQIILSKLFAIIPENLWKITKTIEETIQIPYPGKKCTVCYKYIANQPQQYYCPFKQEHVCIQCAEADDKQQQGNKRFKYIDTLVFINGPLSDPSVLNIDKHKIGENKKLLNGEVGSQLHQFICHGCTSIKEGPRYISLTARPGKYQSRGYIQGYVDFCHECFLVLKQKSEKAKEIVYYSAKDGMVLDSLFTRVLFWHGRYQTF